MSLLILFDIDGTLVSSDRRDSRTFADTFLAFFGYELPTIDWAYYPDVTDSEILRTALMQVRGAAPTIEEERTFKRVYESALRDSRKKDPARFRALPGAVALVHRLMRTSGCSLGLATGGWKGAAQIKLGHVRVKHEAIPVFEGADDRYTRVDILTAALGLATSRYGHMDRVVYVGDAVWDVHTTRKMDLPFVGVRFRGDHDVLMEAGAGQVVTDFSDQDQFMEAIELARPPG